MIIIIILISVTIAAAVDILHSLFMCISHTFAFIIIFYFFLCLYFSEIIFLLSEKKILSVHAFMWGDKFIQFLYLKTWILLLL